jgi:hypothetical protein
MGNGDILEMEHLTFGVRRLAAALLPQVVADPNPSSSVGRVILLFFHRRFL